MIYPNSLPFDLEIFLLSINGFGGAVIDGDMVYDNTPLQASLHGIVGVS